MRSTLQYCNMATATECGRTRCISSTQCSENGSVQTSDFTYFSRTRYDRITDDGSRRKKLRFAVLQSTAKRIAINTRARMYEQQCCEFRLVY